MMSERWSTDCLACRVNQGIDNPPGGIIYDDGLWRVDHRIDPGPILGWLIMKPVRHVEFFDELTDDEAARFGLVKKRIVQALRLSVPDRPEKVYSILLAESSDCPHIHFHIVPRLKSHPREFRGPRIFGYDGPPVESAKVEDLANLMREKL